MKILHLHIKNIASIEQADIDFEHGPLASDPIFLICGETGSGKTTILNAISLALYAQVPALINADKDKSSETDVAINSPVILMRRGAKDAEATLTFEVGNHRYKATWSAHRKRTGKYDTGHSLEDLTDHSVEGLKTAARQRLQQLIGLSFEQFTRTTLLAQGEFSAFLKAKSKEKSDILEKITGTELYSRIGMKIFANMQQADTKAKLTQARIDDAKLLDEQQRAELAAIIDNAGQRLPALDTRLQALQAELEWLKRHAELDAAGKAAGESCRMARQTVESAENQAALLTVARWDATTEIRSVMDEIDSKRKEVAEAKSKIDSLEQRDWHAVADGLAWLTQESDRIKAQALAVKTSVEAESALLPVYDRITKIAEEARAVSDKLLDAQSCLKQAEMLNKKAEDVLKKLPPLEKKAEVAEDTYTRAQALVQACTAEADKDDIDGLRQAQERASRRLSDLDLACRDARSLDQARAAADDAAKELDSRRQTLDITTARLKTDRETLAAAESEYRTSKAMLDGQKELKDHISSMRSLFAETDVCPLCGTQGVHLHSDDTVDSVLQASQERADKARAAYEAAEKAVNEAAATAKVLSSEVQRLLSALASRRSALDAATEAFARTCSTVGVDTAPLPDLDTLSAMAREAQLAREQADRELQAANSRRDKLTQAHRQLTLCAKEREEALASLRKCREQVDGLINQARYNTERAAALDKEADEGYGKFADLFAVSAEAESAVVSRLAEKGIAINRESVRSIAAEVERMHSDYRRLLDENDRLSRLIESADGERLRVEASLAKCRERHSPAPYSPVAVKTASLAERAEALYSELHAQLSVLEDDNAELRQREQDRDNFFATSEIIPDQVQALRAMSRSDIEARRQSTLAHEKALQQAQAALKATSDLMAVHLQRRPHIPDDATIEALSDEKDVVEAEKTKAIAEKSAATQQLETDSRSRANKEHLEQQLKEEKHVQQLWSKLNDLFGQSDGKKFKVVAQSYVLRMLLAKSNHYLRMLTPRYTLVCDDGQLVINVCDAHQGGAIRYAGGLSGGETFIVSLALALGLSSISKEKIDIDTLFIDEGFGTLDQHTLDTVIDTLDRLHQNLNRRVGIISHVDALKERVSTQLRLERTGASSSKVVVKSN